jgi:hypothetical protein
VGNNSGCLEDIVREGLNKNWPRSAATATPISLVPTNTPIPTPTETPILGKWISPYAVYDKCGEEPGHPARAFIDGDTGTYWEHHVSERHWIILDLGGSWTIKKMQVYVGTVDDCDWFDVYIHVSQDALTWERIGSWVPIIGGGKWVTVGVAEEKAGRYIKLSNIVPRSGDKYVRGHEFEAFVK